MYNYLSIIQQCLESQNSNNFYELLNEIKDNMFLTYYTEDSELTNEENLWNEIENKYSEYINNISHIPLIITIHSNYDCITSHWYENNQGYSYNNNYLKTIIDFLNLNPYKVYKLLKEKEYNVLNNFPNFEDRNNHEKVNYKDFIIELENNSCGGNLIFLCYINLKDLININFKINKITIPINSYCGIFNSWQGGGSLIEIKTIHPIEFKKDNYIQLDVLLNYFYNVYGNWDWFNNYLKLE
jgi:hypothetical protein